jgi:hypothetical protein
MTIHKITPTQLRGLIKEALEESVQEIAVDEQIAALKAKGSRRNLQESKQYRKLLEFRMGGMVGMQALGGPKTEVGEEEESVLLGREEETPKEEVSGLRKDVEMLMSALEKSPLVQRRMEKIDQPLEQRMLVAAIAMQLAGSEEGADDLLRLARTYLRGHVEEDSSMMNESRRLRRR